MRGLAMVALSLLCGAPAMAGTYVIAIGVNEPPRTASDGELPLLRYADDDAVRVQQLFAESGAETFLLSVLDDASQRRFPEAATLAREPSLARLRATISEVAARLAGDADGTVVVSYSGHGARAAGGEVFLTLGDAELTEKLLYDELLAALPAVYVHLLIDACHAAGVVGVRGAFDNEVTARAVAVAGDELASGGYLERFPRVGVLLATTAGQEAHEWTRIESGVFTHVVLSALTGAGDVNLDGKVEYSEIEAFVSAANRDLRDPRAVPRLVAKPPRSNRHAPVIALRPTKSATLEGEAGRLGRFHVELENGERYMDAHFETQATTRIYLPANKLAFVRTDTAEAELRLGSGESARFSTLRLRPRETEARGSLDASYHRDLFASPFGVAYYRGFVDSSGGLGVDLGHAAVAPGKPGAGRVGPALLIAAAGLTVAAAASTAIAVDAKNDFERTDIQRDAQAAADRHRVATITAVTSAGLAAATAVLGAYLWGD